MIKNKKPESIMDRRRKLVKDCGLADIMLFNLRNNKPQLSVAEREKMIDDYVARQRLLKV